MCSRGLCTSGILSRNLHYNEWGQVKQLLVFLLFLSPCPIFRSHWAWWDVRRRIIAQHWSSSHRSLSFRTLMSVLVSGSLSFQAVSCVTRDQEQKQNWRVMNINDNISKKACAQICVSALPSVRFCILLLILTGSGPWRAVKPRSIFISKEQSHEVKIALMNFSPTAYGCQVKLSTINHQQLLMISPLKYRSHPRAYA